MTITKHVNILLATRHQGTRRIVYPTGTADTVMSLACSIYYVRAVNIFNDFAAPPGSRIRPLER